MKTTSSLLVQQGKPVLNSTAQVFVQPCSSAPTPHPLSAMISTWFLHFWVFSIFLVEKKNKKNKRKKGGKMGFGNWVEKRFVWHGKWDYELESQFRRMPIPVAVGVRSLLHSFRGIFRAQLFWCDFYSNSNAIGNQPITSLIDSSAKILTLTILIIPSFSLSSW